MATSPPTFERITCDGWGNTCGCGFARDVCGHKRAPDQKLWAMAWKRHAANFNGNETRDRTRLVSSHNTVVRCDNPGCDSRVHLRSPSPPPGWSVVLCRGVGIARYCSSYCVEVDAPRRDRASR